MTATLIQRVLTAWHQAVNPMVSQQELHGIVQSTTVVTMILCSVHYLCTDNLWRTTPQCALPSVSLRRILGSMSEECPFASATFMLHAEVPSSDNPQQGNAAASESAVEQACERLILETVRLLQEGQLEQADALLIEGAVPCMQV